MFLECQGELSVIDLAQRPLRKEEDSLKSLKIIREIKNITTKLQEFNRDNIESGKVFESGRFGDLKNRADMALISDLKIVRQELIVAGLRDDKIKYAHALIGRSIFIRYLEDRKILTKEYFNKVAINNEKWEKILNQPTSWDESNLSEVKAYYPRILRDKEFTYEFYKTLSEDFNGDMFPDVEGEKQNVESKHLDLIQRLLYGDADPQQKLFFFSYKFDIIPLDLISAIYEDFYHTTTNIEKKKSEARQTGAYYTPPVLAEFLISRVLTAEEIKKKPRILDPACGSGIFLVEAFRRIVRYKISEEQRTLDFDELKEILSSQIFGIEYNEEAARITAFSLYLSMLHYLEPCSIQEHIKNCNKLPYLLKSETNSGSIEVGNAFNVKKEYYGTYDLVVGNPPWGSPDRKANAEIKKMNKEMLDWCEANSKPIGNNESSQAFLWLALEFLKDDGVSAMLTSVGVLLKTSGTNEDFRKKFFAQICLHEIYNFTHVRDFFFKGARSPFILIHFSKNEQKGQPIDYWSAKQVVSLKSTQAILLSKIDHNYIINQDITDNKTWKLNWMGRIADERFIKRLDSLEPLSNYTSLHNVGFQVGNKSKPAKWLAKYVIADHKSLSRYKPINFIENNLTMVESRGKYEGCYFGKRIIVKQGVEQKNNAFGKIIARYVSKEFCFTNSIHGLKFKENQEWQYKLLLGCLWSSFARYYLFMTSANWGIRNDKILIKERDNLPVKLKFQNSKTDKIIEIVDKLRDYQPDEYDAVHPNGLSEEIINSKRIKYEKELDEAVFDLYEFSEAQRDLIRDCCEITLPFFYKPYNSIGIESACTKDNTLWIKNYTEIFSKNGNLIWKMMKNYELMYI